MVGSVVLLSYALAFVMPSNMGRIAPLMPIVAAMAAKEMALKRGRARGSAGAGGGVWYFPAVCHHPARQRPESGDERCGGRIIRYPSELCALFTATHAGTGWLKGAVLVALICWLFPKTVSAA